MISDIGGIDLNIRIRHAPAGGLRSATSRGGPLTGKSADIA